MFRAALPVIFLAASLTPCASAQALLKDLRSGTGGSGGFQITSIHGAVLFKAYTPATGYEIYRTDGTTANTQVHDLNRGSGSCIDGSNLVSFGNEAVFYGTNGNGWGLFATNGRASGTRWIASLTVGGKPAQWVRALLADKGVAYISGQDAQGVPVLFRTDGTTAGTGIVQHFRGYKGALFVRSFAGGRLLFSLFTTSSQELWSTDGTALGTRRLMKTSGANIYFGTFARIGKLAYFVLERATQSPIWVTDGTAAGTKVATTLSQRHCRSVTAFRGGLITIGVASTGALEMWRVDSSAPNGTRLTTLKAKTGTTDWQLVIPADDVAYVFDTALQGHVPGHSTGWRTNGTVAGTSMFLPISRGITVSDCFALGNHVVFSGTESKYGREPWISDGTSTGTRLLFDVWSGTRVSNPMGFALAADLAMGPALLFSATDRQHGREPRILPMISVAAPAFVAVRPGCAAAAPTPQLVRVGGQPSIGNRAFGLEVRARPNSAAAVLFDFNVGAAISGCATLFNPAVILVARTNSTGAFRVAAPVPNSTALIGRRVYAQAMGAAPRGALFGVIDTGGVRALILGR